MSRLAVKGSKLFDCLFFSFEVKSCWNKIRVNWLAFVLFFLWGRGGKTLSFLCRKLGNWREEENGNLKTKKHKIFLNKRRAKL